VKDEGLNTWAFPLLVVAPHMDDEALACGGVLARLAGRGSIRIVFVGDGLGSFPRAVRIGPDADRLRRRRREEAAQAARELGLPVEALTFLGFEEWVFHRHFMALGAALNEILLEMKPATLLCPFRYDRHGDHLAVHAAAMALTHESAIRTLEYFVYHRWRMLPGGDIRRWIGEEYRVEVPVGAQAQSKRRAIEAYASQTRVEPGLREVPVLSAALIDEECRGSEYFVDTRQAPPDGRLFSGWRWWIPVAHAIEPPLKRLKDALRI